MQYRDIVKILTFNAAVWAAVVVAMFTIGGMRWS